MQTTKKRKAGSRFAACAAWALVIAAAAALAACAPQSSSTEGSPAADDATAPAAEVAWSADGDCSVCHDKQCSAGSEPGTTLGAFHEGLGNDCSSCHDSATLAEIHEQHGDSGRTPTKLRYSEVTDEQCLACHGSYESLAEKTAGTADLTDTNGKTVNPHDLPQSTVAGEGHDTIKCVSCHNVHVVADCAEQAETTCRGCHHSGVFECGTCHE